VLKRAQNTLGSILKELGQEDIPISKTWRLNERHYGGLTGLNKSETAAKYGEEQVIITCILVICYFDITLFINLISISINRLILYFQVQIWRRSFDTPPPAMDTDHAYYDQIVNDPRYKDEPLKEEFPMFESLKLTIQRTLPYWNDVIIPQLKEGKQILIAAHGNSLRGIVKHLDSKFSIQFLKFEIMCHKS